MNDLAPGSERRLQADPLDRMPVDFTAFYVQEQSGYLRYARNRLRHREDAEDAVQNAGAVLYRNWRRALASEEPRSFAFKILKDAIADVLRERHRAEQKRLRVIAQRNPDTSQDDLEELAELDALDWAMEELARAAPVQADVVRLRQAGRSYLEIGSALGIAHTTAKTYYSLGRRHLEYLLEQADRDAPQEPGPAPGGGAGGADPTAADGEPGKGRTQ